MASFDSETLLKFLCDQMLARLGRWLRAAGYDTVIIDISISDKEIYEQSVREDRILLTRDKHFLSMPDSSQRVIWLKANYTEDCAKELTQKLKLNWQYQPFSRCLLCNSLLVEAPQNLYSRLPSDILPQEQPVRYCAHCDQLFWLGSHTKRMLDQFKSFDR